MDKTLLTEAAPIPGHKEAILNFKIASGIMTVKIPYIAIQHSGLITNLINDLGEDCINEPIQLSAIGLDKITDKGFNIFIKCWTDYYDTIPNNLENASIYRFIEIPNVLISIFKLDETDDQKWDVTSIADCIKLANFLDISRLLIFFKLMLSKWVQLHAI